MKGQTLLSIIVGISGIILTAGIGFSLTKINTQDEKLYDQGARLSVVETEIRRLPVIESKIDRLLEDRGYNPLTLKVK